MELGQPSSAAASRHGAPPQLGDRLTFGYWTQIPELASVILLFWGRDARSPVPMTAMGVTRDKRFCRWLERGGGNPRVSKPSTPGVARRVFAFFITEKRAGPPFLMGR